MSYIKANLIPGEEVNIYIQQSKWLLVPVAFFLLLGLILFPNQSTSTAGVIFLLLGVFLFLRWRSFEFAITNKRVISKKGIISTETNEISIQKIESVSMKKSLINPYGDVVIQGTGGKDVVFKDIASPQSIRDVLFKELEKRV